MAVSAEALKPGGLIIESSEAPQDRCGLVMLYANQRRSLLPMAVEAGKGIQHRGQLGAGIVMATEVGLERFYGDGLLHDVFDIRKIRKVRRKFTDGILYRQEEQSVVEKLDQPADWLILQARYATDGAESKRDKELTPREKSLIRRNYQPCFGLSPDGTEVVVAHNGQFVDVEGLRRKVLDKVKIPDAEKASDTYLFTQLLANAEGETWDEKVKNAVAQVDGAFNLQIGIKNPNGDTSVYIARDDFSLHPLWIQEKNGVTMVSSETIAFRKAGFDEEAVEEVPSGSILRIDSSGTTIVKQGSDGPKAVCAFELSYFERNDSMYQIPGTKEWISMSEYRERVGRKMAELHLIKADYVIGIPDSGVPMSIGYSNGSGIPYLPGIIREREESKRTFMADQDPEQMRTMVVKKLSVVKDRRIRGARIIIGDDSVVRGNVTSKVIRALREECGAAEIYVVAGFYPVNHRCPLGVNMQTEEELIASRHGVGIENIDDTEAIAREIGADGVFYPSPSILIETYNEVPASKSRKALEVFLANQMCGGCGTGVYPVDQEGIRHTAFKRDPNAREPVVLFEHAN